MLEVLYILLQWQKVKSVAQNWQAIDFTLYTLAHGSKKFRFMTDLLHQKQCFLHPANTF